MAQYTAVITLAGAMLLVPRTSHRGIREAVRNRHGELVDTPMA
jgi:hypothetical protein